LLIFDPFYLIYAIPFYPYRIPALVLSVYPLLDYDPFVPPYTSPLTPDSSFQSWLLVQAAWLKRYLHYQPYRLRMWARKYLIGYSPYSLSERVAELHGFPLAEEWTTRPLSFDYRLASVPEIVLHSERFDLPRKNPLRPTVYYVGPCVDLHRYEPPFDWSRITVGKKLIFCSIGTVGPKDGFEEGFLRRVIAAVATLLQYTLVMSVGPGIDPQELGPIPQNVHVYSFVPQIEVLRHADLMISHGGANSIKECVLLGVPLLVYPRRADQPGNSARVIYHGLGLRGDLRKDTVAMIASKIKSVLDDARYATNVAAMRAHFESYQESQRHVQVIESFLQQPLDGSRIHDDRDPVVV
jgi:MGT family glycosyltransferase